MFQEEAIPELEIDVDELLDMPSDVERAARVKVGRGRGLAAHTLTWTRSSHTDVDSQLTH